MCYPPSFSSVTTPIQFVFYPWRSLTTVFQVVNFQPINTFSVCILSFLPEGLSTKSQAIFHNIHSVHMTNFLACYGSLWVGTNLGILVNFPLPRLEGVPLVNGPAMVAYHTHGGPVKFMLALEINRQSDRIHYSTKEDSNDGKCFFSIHL